MNKIKISRVTKIQGRRTSHVHPVLAMNIYKPKEYRICNFRPVNGGFEFLVPIMDGMAHPFKLIVNDAGDRRQVFVWSFNEVAWGEICGIERVNYRKGKLGGAKVRVCLDRMWGHNPVEPIERGMIDPGKAIFGTLADGQTLVAETIDTYGKKPRHTIKSDSTGSSFNYDMKDRLYVYSGINLEECEVTRKTGDLIELTGVKK